MRRWAIALVVVLVLAVAASIAVFIGMQNGLRRMLQTTEENQARAEAVAQAQARAYAEAVRDAAHDTVPDDAELRALGEPQNVIVVRVTRAPGLSLTLSSAAPYATAVSGASAIVCFTLDVTQAGTANVDVELEELPACPAP